MTFRAALLQLALMLALTANARATPTIETPDKEILSVTPPLTFAVESGLEKNRQFWISIYTQYYTYQGLIHDAKYIDHIYEVIDLRSFPGGSARADREEKHKWKQILLSLHRKTHGQADGPQPPGLTDDEKKLFLMYADVHEPNKFFNATHRKRLRLQIGQRENFLAGLRESGAYLPLMEAIFRQNGLPIELTRLPFVESSFNVHARSKVGASGIWQFMRSTGKLFLQINDAVDERNDPIRATEAAAQLLRGNYESLRSWPLAVTAYNHGRKGMMRAVRKVGSEDLEDVVEGYKSRSFGFASSNFFTELLAAIEVEKNADKFFGKVDRLVPTSFYEAKIPDYIAMKDICDFLKFEPSRLRELNPGLTDAVFEGTRMIPAGYQLRLPYDGKLSKEATLRVFQDGYAQIPTLYKLRAQKRIKRGRVYGKSS
jgi:membrane-bound lytic murein transglycosylase D